MVTSCKSLFSKYIITSNITVDSKSSSISFDLKGASRTVGGLFRGNASGNALNAADYPETEDFGAITIKGLLFIYKSPTADTAPDPSTARSTVRSRVVFTRDALVLATAIIKQHIAVKGMFIYLFYYLHCYNCIPRPTVLLL